MKFSIIIPCYKVEAYLPECLDSLLAQSFSDWEAIIVDDGSPDRSGEIADEYAQKDPRFKVVHQANGGLSAARNAGMAVAKGDFLLFLDSDDLFVSNALKILADNLISYPNVDVLAFGSTLWYSESGNRRESNILFNHKEIHLYQSGLDYLDYFVRTRGWGPSAACFYAYRFESTLMGDLQFPNGMLHEDELFVPQVICRSREVITIPEELYIYRMRESSIAHQHTEKSCLDKLQIALRLSSFFSVYTPQRPKMTDKIIHNLCLNGMVGLRKMGKAYPYDMVKLSWRTAHGLKQYLKLLKKLYL